MWPELVALVLSSVKAVRQDIHPDDYKHMSDLCQDIENDKFEYRVAYAILTDIMSYVTDPDFLEDVNSTMSVIDEEPVVPFTSSSSSSSFTPSKVSLPQMPPIDCPPWSLVKPCLKRAHTVLMEADCLPCCPSSTPSDTDLLPYSSLNYSNLA